LKIRLLFVPSSIRVLPGFTYIVFFYLLGVFVILALKLDAFFVIYDDVFFTIYVDNFFLFPTTSRDVKTDIGKSLPPPLNSYKSLLPIDYPYSPSSTISQSKSANVKSPKQQISRNRVYVFWMSFFC